MYVRLSRTQFSRNRFFILRVRATETAGGKWGPMEKYEQFHALKNYWFFMVKKHETPLIAYVMRFRAVARSREYQCEAILVYISHIRY